MFPARFCRHALLLGSVRHFPKRRGRVSLALSAAWFLSASRRTLAIIAEGKGRPIISNAGDISKAKPAGVADALEQFADRLLNLKSPAKRAHDRTPFVTSPSLERATLRSLALSIFENYPHIPWYHPEKQGWEKTRILQFLAEECTPSHETVCEAAETFAARCKSTDPVDDSVSNKPSMTNLQQACTPEYESIITHLLQIQADQALAFLLLLRRDLLNWISYQYDQPSHDPVTLMKCRHLDNYLCRLFQTWFAPGMLQVERITYDSTSAAVIERIARNEAVHPVQDLQDLRRRLGPDRRVFCIFHPLLSKTQPLLVLYVALTEHVPESMQVIHNSKSTHARVATFYSISNFETGLKGVGLGEYLIHQAVDLLQSELPTIETFCTLSPLPKFRAWLEERSTASSGKFASQDLLDVNTTQQLATEFNVSPEHAIPAMLEYLQNHAADASALVNPTDDSNESLLAPAIEQALLKLAAHYLLHEKHRRQPLDPVARFHVGNGALVHALRWRADSSRKGWANSFGIMVNYRYDLARLVDNQAQYEGAFAMPVSENVRALLD
jgi:malonyl-CoA decarboxylase